MAEQSVTVSGTIPAPPERVWQVLTDLDRAPETIPSISAVERLTAGPYDVGTRWRETRTMMGRTETHELEVTESVPPRRTVVTTRTGGTVYTSTMRLSPEGEGTRLELAFGGEQPDASLPQRVAMRLLGPIGAAMTRRMLQKEMREIRVAAVRG